MRITPLLAVATLSGLAVVVTTLLVDETVEEKTADPVTTVEYRVPPGPQLTNDEQFMQEAKKDGVATFVADLWINEGLPAVECNTLLESSDRYDAYLQLAVLTGDTLSEYVTDREAAQLVLNTMEVYCPQHDWRN